MDNRKSLEERGTRVCREAGGREGMVLVRNNKIRIP
jgi:hypothetical protein